METRYTVQQHTLPDPDDVYMGIIAVGDWGSTVGDIATEYATINAVADIGSYEDVKDTVAPWGVSEEQYHPIDPDDGKISKEFFTDIDVIYIASPNQYHKEQTLRALDKKKNGAVVATEKCFDTTMSGSLEVMEYATDDDLLWDPDHYNEKLLSKWVEEHLPVLTDTHGPVEHVDLTFIEASKDKDQDRYDYTHPDSGGIMMDWKHAPAILAHNYGAAIADEGLQNVQSFETSDQFAYPTAVSATFNITEGNQPIARLSNDATATIHVGKEFDQGATTKSVRTIFEDEWMLILDYCGTNAEAEQDVLGTATMYSERGNAVYQVDLTGSHPLEFNVANMVAATETDEPPISLDQEIEALRAVDMVNNVIFDEDHYTVADADRIASLQETAQQTAEPLSSD